MVMADKLVSAEKLDEHNRAIIKKGLETCPQGKGRRKGGQRTPGGSAGTKAAIGG